MLISSVAWRNVWRNRKRSLIVMIAVMLGTTAGVFTCGLIIGWSDQRIDSAVYVEESHLKLYNPDFLNNEDLTKILPDADKISAFLDKQQQVQSYSKRIKVMTMATTSHGTAGLMLNGVDLTREKKVSTLYRQLVAGGGRYPEADDVCPIFISDRLAEQLRVKSYVLPAAAVDSLVGEGLEIKTAERLHTVCEKRFNTKKLFEKSLESLLSKREVAEFGPALTKAAIHYRLRSRILLTFSDRNGELVNQAFRVSGIYHTQNAAFDLMNAFVPEKDLRPLTGLEAGACHEIAVLLKDDNEPEELQKQLNATFPNTTSLTWKELVPDAGMMAEYMSFFNYIIMGFILFALAFGIINTMMMAILERTKELGMLLAIGMNKGKVFSMIMLETIYLTLAGAVAGMLTGWLVIAITGHTGLDFSSVGEGFEAMGWSAIMYPSITPGYFFGITLLVILAGVLSSILPARKALSLNPVEALRTDN